MLSGARLWQGVRVGTLLRSSVLTPSRYRRQELHSRRLVSARAAMELGPTDAVNLIASGEFEYLDVRTPEEFAGGRCPNSVNIPIMFAGPGGMTPNEKFMEQVAEKFPNPESDHIAVGCKAGPRATKAIAMLSAANYQHLLNVLGGFTAWEAAGLPIEK